MFYLSRTRWIPTLLLNNIVLYSRNFWWHCRSFCILSNTPSPQTQYPIDILYKWRKHKYFKAVQWGKYFTCQGLSWYFSDQPRCNSPLLLYMRNVLLSWQTYWETKNKQKTNLQMVFHSGCTIYNPTNNIWGFPFLHILGNTCDCSSFW